MACDTYVAHVHGFTGVERSEIWGATRIQAVYRGRKVRRLVCEVWDNWLQMVRSLEHDVALCFTHNLPLLRAHDKRHLLPVGNISGPESESDLGPLAMYQSLIPRHLMTNISSSPLLRSQHILLPNPQTPIASEPPTSPMNMLATKPPTLGEALEAYRESPVRLLFK